MALQGHAQCLDDTAHACLLKVTGASLPFPIRPCAKANLASALTTRDMSLCSPRSESGTGHN